jgi:hypothetical protein
MLKDTLHLKNRAFCYCLQGYFEISSHPTLTEQRIHLILEVINNITEPLGVYTKWLKELLESLIVGNYNQKLTAAMQALIQKELNGIFLHVIDPSYETEYSSDELLKIHQGDSSLLK